MNLTCTQAEGKDENILTLILLTWKIWRAPNNASNWQMGLKLGV